MDTPLCPNCGQPIEAGKRTCLNCGADVSAVWPPPPSSEPPEGPPLKDIDSVQRANGLGTGCLLSIAAYFILTPAAYMASLIRRFPHDYPSMHRPSYFRYGTWVINLVTLALVAALYFALGPRYPSFARGLRYCLIVILVLLLFGLANCRND